MNARWTFSAVIALSTLASTPTLCRATEETVVHVAQPIDTGNEVSIATMGYIEMIGSVLPGAGVHLVGASNCMGVRGDTEQRNSAFDLGIQTGIELSREPTGLFGDTLRVFMDLAHLKATSDSTVGDSIVARTIDCVLITAWYGRVAFDPVQGRIEAKHVDLRIRGSKVYQRCAGVYACADVLPKVTDNLSP